MSIQYPEQLEYYLNFARKHVDEEDARAVLATLADHIGEDNQTTLETLALVAYGRFNSSTERKTRAALELLVSKYGIPVGAHSGKAGRWLIISTEEMAHVQNDLYSRAAQSRKRADALGRINLWPKLDTPVPERQVALFDIQEPEPTGFWQAHWGR